MRLPVAVFTSATCALVAVALHASPVRAQSLQVTTEVANAIVVSDPTFSSWLNPVYLADRSAGSNFSGVVNLIFDRVGGKSACTGSYLGGGKILTAAHCVSDGTALTTTGFTARFYQMGEGWVDVTGTGISVKSGYSGAVVEDNDVAVLTLSSAAPSWARTYSLASGNILGQAQTFAGYGLVGNGIYGDQFFDNNQFSDRAVLRYGQNVFETTCRTGFMCATALNLAPGEYGGILMSDLDRSNVSSPGTLCNSLGFCSVGFPDFREVTTGRGDSGGAAFLSDWTISGVASFGESSNGILGGFGFAEGHTCVANVANNARCQSNYRFVTSQVVQVVPEPATSAMLAVGLLVLAGAVRRKRIV